MLCARAPLFLVCVAAALPRPPQGGRGNSAQTGSGPAAWLRFRPLEAASPVVVRVSRSLRHPAAGGTARLAGIARCGAFLQALAQACRRRSFLGGIGGSPPHALVSASFCPVRAGASPALTGRPSAAHKGTTPPTGQPSFRSSRAVPPAARAACPGSKSALPCRARGKAPPRPKRAGARYPQHLFRAFTKQMYCE